MHYLLIKALQLYTKCHIFPDSYTQLQIYHVRMLTTNDSTTPKIRHTTHSTPTQPPRLLNFDLTSSAPAFCTVNKNTPHPRKLDDLKGNF